MLFSKAIKYRSSKFSYQGVILAVMLQACLWHFCPGVHSNTAATVFYHSLYILYLRREKLTFQYAIRLAANQSNPAHKVTFPPYISDELLQFYDRRDQMIPSNSITNLELWPMTMPLRWTRLSRALVPVAIVLGHQSQLQSKSFQSTFNQKVTLLNILSKLFHG